MWQRNLARTGATGAAGTGDGACFVAGTEVHMAGEDDPGAWLAAAGVFGVVAVGQALGRNGRRKRRDDALEDRSVDWDAGNTLVLGPEPREPLPELSAEDLDALCERLLFGDDTDVPQGCFDRAVDAGSESAAVSVLTRPVATLRTTPRARTGRRGAEAIAPRPRSHRLSWLGILLPLVLGAFCLARGLVPSAPPTKPIEQIALGDRVSGVNPLLPSGDHGLPEPDPSTWRSVRILAYKPGGELLSIEVLRPLAWMDANGVEAGSTIALDLVELSFRGEGRVVSVGRCPEIRAGRGHVVTGRFVHSRAEILDLTVAGSDQPIGTTAVHPFWSEDRQTFVPAGELRVRERLRRASGRPVQITSLSRRGPPAPVYNVEVHGQHVYRVGLLGVLVHNQKMPDPQEVTLWNAPQPSTPVEQIMDEINHGFDPTNYPGMGPFLATDPSIAENFHFHYQNGMQEFHMPQQTFESLTQQGIIQPDPSPQYPPGASWHVPPLGLPQFNQGIQQGTPNLFHPNGMPN